MKKSATIWIVILCWLFCVNELMAQAPGTLDQSFGSGGKVMTDFWQNGDYIKIVTGVDTIWSPGSPGPIAALSNTAVPIASGEATANSPSLFAIANKVDQGRVFALGHDGLVEDHGISYFDNLTLVINGFGWLDHLNRKKAIITTGHGEWAGATNTLTIQQQLTKLGFSVQAFGGRLTKDMLKDVGVVFIGIAWEDFTQEELTALQDFLHQGGGLFLVGLGWSWEPYHPGRTLDDYPMNVIGAFSGVRWIGGGIVDPSHQYQDSPLFLKFYPKTLNQYGYDYGYSVALQRDGKIVVAGSASNGNNSDFAVVRYNSDGSLDKHFGNGGKVLTDFGGNDEGRGVVIQSDGKIVVAGSASNGNNSDFAVVRYNSDGSLDKRFGTGGKVLTDFGSNGNDYGYSIAYGYSILLERDGKIVVVGKSFENNEYGFALAKYHSDGRLDNSFGDNGKVISQLVSYHQNGSVSGVIQQDGKIVVLGNYKTEPQFGYYSAILARYNSSGELDTTFGYKGREDIAFVTFSSSYWPRSSSATSLAIQPNRKIVVAGYCLNNLTGIGQDFALALCKSNGILDSTFGTDARVLTDFNSSDYCNDIALQTDGRIIAVGTSAGLFTLARYSMNGDLDDEFGTGGKVQTDFGFRNASGQSAVIQTDGKIIVAGYAWNGNDYDFALARYYGGSTAGVADRSINALSCEGSDVYAGGNFTDAGGNANADYIARWDGANWKALGSGLNGLVNTVAISSPNAVYAGGNFTDAGGNASADYVARWDGKNWQPLGNRVNGPVYAIVSRGKDLYAGGSFGTNGIGSANVARWDGTDWRTMAGGLNRNVYALGVKGDELYAGGNFTDAGGDLQGDYIACWDGKAWHAVGSGLNDQVFAIAVSGNDVYVGGNFTKAGGNPTASYIARWDGKSWHALDHYLWGAVKAIVVQGKNVYVGGYFNRQGYIARWDGKKWYEVGGGTNGAVEALAIGQHKLYAGGSFTVANGIPAEGFAWWPLGKSGTASEEMVLEGVNGVEGKSYSYALDQNYPNPFNPTTTIRFSMPQAGTAALMIYDILGRVVVSRELTGQAGWNAYQLDASRLSSGMYYYRLTSGGFTKTLKMLLVK